jgi:hypothetical protein
VEQWEEEGGMETTVLEKHNLIQDSKGNEENRYPVPDPKNKKRNDTKYPAVHKNTLKEEHFQEITENFMEKILDVVNKNVQDALKKFQDNKNKEYGKTQEQINEQGGALNKHQSQTENTIYREINVLKMKIKSTEENVTPDMENLRKKNKQKHKTWWKATPAD